MVLFFDTKINVLVILLSIIGKPRGYILLGKQDGRIPLLLFRISSTLAVTQGEAVKTGVRECIKKWNEITTRKTTGLEFTGTNKDFIGEVMRCLLKVLSTLPGR